MIRMPGFCKNEIELDEMCKGTGKQWEKAGKR